MAGDSRRHLWIMPDVRVGTCKRLHKQMELDICKTGSVWGRMYKIAYTIGYIFVYAN